MFVNLCEASPELKDSLFFKESKFRVQNFLEQIKRQTSSRKTLSQQNREISLQSAALREKSKNQRRLIAASAFKRRRIHLLPSSLLNSYGALKGAIHKEVAQEKTTKEKLREALFLESITAPNLTLHDLEQKAL